MKKIKKYLIKLIGMDNYRTLIVKIFRFINFYHKKLELCVDVDKIKIIKMKNKTYFTKLTNNANIKLHIRIILFIFSIKTLTFFNIIYIFYILTNHQYFRHLHSKHK